MPIYPYKCDFCANYLEIERGVDEDRPTPACTNCGVHMNRVWSAPSVQFRGSGFYSTDK